MKEEKINIKIKVKNPTKNDIRLISVIAPFVRLSSLDSANIKYKFNINYLGRTVKTFGAIIKLIKNGHATQATIEALNDGEILIQKLLDYIREVKKYRR